MDQPNDRDPIHHCPLMASERETASCTEERTQPGGNPHQEPCRLFYRYPKLRRKIGAYQYHCTVPVTYSWFNMSNGPSGACGYAPT